jgi:hypothetical protein
MPRDLRRVVGLVVVFGSWAFAACSFRASPATDEATDEATPDAAPTDPSGEVGAPPPAQFCDPADPALIACYQFESDARDGSSHHLDARTDHVAYVASKDAAHGMALQLKDDSAADVSDSAALDASSLTIEAWIEPAQLPGAVADIIDVNRQYTLQIMDNGDLHCGLVGGKSLTFSAAIAKDRWIHVACTYDGATDSSRLYLDGSQVATGVDTDPDHLATAGTDGLSIAADNAPTGGLVLPFSALDPPDPRSRYLGRIDDLRLMSVARTPAQICADAGRAGCP